MGAPPVIGPGVLIRVLRDSNQYAGGIMPKLRTICPWALTSGGINSKETPLVNSWCELVSLLSAADINYFFFFIAAFFPAAFFGARDSCG